MTGRWDHPRRPGPHRFSARTRRIILQRDPECRLQLFGCTIESTTCDHIVGWADAQALGWTDEEINHPDNGQGVCRPCHNIKTADEAKRGRKRAQAAGRTRNRPTRPHHALRANTNTTAFNPPQ